MMRVRSQGALGIPPSLGDGVAANPERWGESKPLFHQLKARWGEGDRALSPPSTCFPRALCLMLLLINTRLGLKSVL